MIANYYADADGVIHQLQVGELQTYDKQYIETRYHQYPEKCRQMAHLRLGYITGAINRVPSSILDVGYGAGDFLQAASTVVPDLGGYDITGIQPPPGVAKVESIFERHWHVVTMFDVLEHIEDPSIIRDLQCSFLVVSIPWCHYPDDEWFRWWKHRRPDEHLHHFNDRSLIRFMRRHGYEITSWPCAIEDSIRGQLDGRPNIMTGIFHKSQ